MLGVMPASVPNTHLASSPGRLADPCRGVHGGGLPWVTVWPLLCRARQLVRPRLWLTLALV